MFFTTAWNPKCLWSVGDDLLLDPVDVLHLGHHLQLAGQVDREVASADQLAQALGQVEAASHHCGQHHTCTWPGGEQL